MLAQSQHKARFSLVLLCLLSLASLRGWAAKSAKELPGADIFDATNVLHLAIEVPEEGVSALNNYHWRYGGNRPEAKAVVSDGKTKYTNVALHLKGSAGSYRGFESKPAMTLNFEKLVPGRSFHGLHKFSLNNSVQDRSYICEKICREMFEKAGVPVPRADYALVTLNGRRMGLYVLLEGYNRQFLKRYFTNVTGNFYDAGFCQDITGDLTVNSGDKPDDHTALRKLVSATSNLRQKTDLAEISKILDVDRFLAMVALEVMQCHWDGYAMKPNNFRLFHDAGTGRMVFMPHGLDQMFGRGGQGSTSLPIIPYMNGFVAHAVISNAEGRDRYLKKFSQIFTNVFQLQEITNRVMQIASRIAPVMAEHNESRASQEIREAQYLCESIVDRWSMIDQQLIIPSRATKFQNGVAPVEGWRARTTAGSLNFDVSSDLDGKKTLHLAASQPGSSGSFRTRMILKAGRYKFEGLVRTEGSEATGANLRVTGATANQVLNGNKPWTKAAFLFEVEDPAAEVELICELRGSKGEAWFDAESLKLREITP